MNEQILAFWDKAVVAFAENCGHDPVGDAYIAEIRDKISEHSWKEDVSPEVFRLELDILLSRELEVQRFVNSQLVWDFYDRVKPILEKNVRQPPKVVDRGYKWYKDYGD